MGRLNKRIEKLELKNVPDRVWIRYIVANTDSDAVKEIAKAKAVAMTDLPDPESDQARAEKPEWLILVGVCTHLGCVPLGQAGEYNGWFCPCHGSHYDTSGRIRKGPAPTNLPVPAYVFLDDSNIKIG